MSAFKLCAFDLYGTLLDTPGRPSRLAGLLGVDAASAGGLLAAWRKAQIDRTWELNRTGVYEPFDGVTAWALALVAPSLDPAVRQRLVDTWLTLPAYPDAAAAVATLA